MITIYNYYTTYNSAPLRHLKFKLIVIPIEATLEVHIHYAITTFKSYIVMVHRTISFSYIYNTNSIIPLMKTTEKQSKRLVEISVNQMTSA